MKKRIISIFLVISLVVSTFAISVVSTSAASKPATPKIGSVNNLNGFVNVNWSRVSGAAQYCMWYQVGNNTRWYSVYTTNNYWNIQHPTPGTKFTIKISAVDKNKIHSAYSDTKVITYTLFTPSYGINYTKDKEKFNIYWNKIYGANGYELVYFHNGEKVQTYSGNKTSFIQQDADGKSNIISGDTYCYQVRAVYRKSPNSVAYSAWSKYVPVCFKPASYEKAIKEAEQKVYSYFTSHGLNKAAACGIMGNIKLECSFAPNIYSRVYKDTAGINAAGICAWTGDNYTRFIRDCPNWKNSLDAQIEYLYQTLIKNGQGSPSDKYYYYCTGCWSKLKAVSNTRNGAVEAAKIFSRYYEYSIAGNEGSRALYAQNYWDIYAK